MNRLNKNSIRYIIGFNSISCTYLLHDTIQCDINDSKVSLNSSQKTILVKLGGSALTHKSQFETLNSINLEKTADDIENSILAGNRIVLVHGAGSFGHFQAKQYKLSSGGIDEQETHSKFPREYGLAITRRSVLKLNSFVLDSLLARKIPAVTCSLFPTVKTCGKYNITQEGSLKCIKDLIMKKFLIVLHGDVVLDSIQKCSVYGGDYIMKW